MHSIRPPAATDLTIGKQVMKNNIVTAYFTWEKVHRVENYEFYTVGRGSKWRKISNALLTTNNFVVKGLKVGKKYYF